MERIILRCNVGFVNTIEDKSNVTLFIQTYIHTWPVYAFTWGYVLPVTPYMLEPRVQKAFHGFQSESFRQKTAVFKLTCSHVL